MRVLVTGRGGSAGSWKIRGEQLGTAMGATVKSMATLADMREHDAVLVVKRVPAELLDNLRKSGKPWLYDIVDAYPQPECGVWSRARAIEWLAHGVAELTPTAIVWPNQRMRYDAGRMHEHVVYHHSRLDMSVNPIRPRIKTIGYEGAASYIEPWLPTIANECAHRGFSFSLNPVRLSDLDVAIAMRGGLADGYVQRNWKSNVKLANAHASGTPFIGARESGYEETSTGAEYWADTRQEFSRALDWLDDENTRLEIRHRFLPASITVRQAATDMLAAINAM